MKTTALIAVAGMAAVASAQTMTISWTVSDTGNGDGIIEPGESALLTMSADMNPRWRRLRRLHLRHHRHR